MIRVVGTRTCRYGDLAGPSQFAEESLIVATPLTLELPTKACPA